MEVLGAGCFLRWVLVGHTSVTILCLYMYRPGEKSLFQGFLEIDDATAPGRSAPLLRCSYAPRTIYAEGS